MVASDLARARVPVRLPIPQQHAVPLGCVGDSSELALERSMRRDLSSVDRRSALDDATWIGYRYLPYPGRNRSHLPTGEFRDAQRRQERLESTANLINPVCAPPKQSPAPSYATEIGLRTPSFVTQHTRCCELRACPAVDTPPNGANGGDEAIHMPPQTSAACVLSGAEISREPGAPRTAFHGADVPKRVDATDALKNPFPGLARRHEPVPSTVPPERRTEVVAPGPHYWLDARGQLVRPLPDHCSVESEYYGGAYFGEPQVVVREGEPFWGHSARSSIVHGMAHAQKCIDRAPFDAHRARQGLIHVEAELTAPVDSVAERADSAFVVHHPDPYIEDRFGFRPGTLVENPELYEGYFNSHATASYVPSLHGGGFLPDEMGGRGERPAVVVPQPRLA